MGAGRIGLAVRLAVKAAQADSEVAVLPRHEFQSQRTERLGVKNILHEKEGCQGIAQASGGKYFSAPLNKGIVMGDFDVIYDGGGNSNTLKNCLRPAKANGKVVRVDTPRQPMTKVDMTPIG